MEIKTRDNQLIIDGKSFNNGIINSSSNCKLSTIEGIANFLYALKYYKIDIEEVFNVLSKERSRIFFCTIINEETLRELKNNTTILYAVSVPIGYGEGLQYHCAFTGKKQQVYARRLKEKTKFITVNEYQGKRNTKLD